MDTLNAFDNLLSMEDHCFQAWLVDQGLSEKEKAIWCFHYWMKKESNLSASTALDYRRDVASNWDFVQDNISDDSLSTQEVSAVNKFEKFKKSDFMEAVA